MLEKLFISKVRIKMLEQYLYNPKQEYHVRGLVRIMKEEINAVRRELQNLEAADILVSQRKGNKLFYRLNTQSPFLSELTTLLQKDRQDVQKIHSAISKVEEIDLAIVTHSFLTGEYATDQDIDLFFVGELNLGLLTAEIKKLEKELEKELRITVMKPKDLEFNLKRRDSFLLNILQKDKIILIGSAEDLA